MLKYMRDTFKKLKKRGGMMVMQKNDGMIYAPKGSPIRWSSQENLLSLPLHSTMVTFTVW
jgi:hypothetical protein